MRSQRFESVIRFAVVTSFCAVVVALAFAVINAPNLFAYFGADAADENARSSAQRQALLLLFGGILAALTAVLSYLRHRRENAALDIDRDRHWTSRYTEAVKQLGDDSSTINYGGIYALQRLASEKSTSANPWMVTQMLSAHIREKTAPLRELWADHRGVVLKVDGTVVAALKALERLSFDRIVPADLSRTYLSKVDMRYGFFRGVDFQGAVLSGADLSESRLSDCCFDHAVLRSANLTRADLEDASFVRADLTAAGFVDVDLKGCDIKGADLNGASLEGADLRGVLNWTSQQLNSVLWNDATKWPEGFKVNPAPEDD